MFSKLIVTKFHLMVLGLLIGLMVAAFFKVPAAGLPVHWNFNGRPDRFWSRDQALVIFPVAGVVVTVLFGLFGLVVPQQNLERGRQGWEIILAGLLVLGCAIEFGLMLIGVGSDIPMLPIIGGVVTLVLLGLGVVLPGARPKGYSSMALPWPIAEGRAWTATHRVTGGLFIMGGIILGATTWLGPDPRVLLSVLFGCLIVPFLVGGLTGAAIHSRAKR